jgi:hypothetical protein
MLAVLVQGRVVDPGHAAAPTRGPRVGAGASYSLTPVTDRSPRAGITIQKV